MGRKDVSVTHFGTMTERMDRRDEMARMIAFAETGFEARSGGRDITRESIDAARVDLAEVEAQIEPMVSRPVH